MKPSEWLGQFFWPYIDRSDPFGCWLWKGHGRRLAREREQKVQYTYGTVTIEGKSYGAHRIAWNITYGTTRGLWVLHKCDLPRCCNPHHLYLGDYEMNVQDAIARGRLSPLSWIGDELYDFYEQDSLRDFLLDEDLRDEIVGRTETTAQRNRFDNARMLSDRNVQVVTEGNAWEPPEPCEIEIDDDN